MNDRLEQNVISSNLNSCRPLGHKLLSITKKKCARLSNMMELGSYAVLYVPLKYLGICCCSKNNTQFVQSLFISESVLCLSLRTSISPFLLLGKERVRTLLDYLVTFH